MFHGYPRAGMGRGDRNLRIKLAGQRFDNAGAKAGRGSGGPGFVLRQRNAEKPDNQWNTVELICFEGQSLHIVNGQVVMVLKNSRYQQDGRDMPMWEGKIQLQSEAAEVFYKNIRLQPLDKLPAQYAGYF